MSRPRFIALLLVLGTLAVYLPAAHHPFTLFDDGDYVYENQMVQRGLTWDGFVWAFGYHAANWHPLTWLSHMADCQLFGPNDKITQTENLTYHFCGIDWEICVPAGAHHIVDVMLHAANSFLVLLLLLRWTNALWPSAFAAALFAWHPLHVESVAWISERKDVLSTFLALLALLAYTRYVRESTVHSPKSKVFYVLALVCFALGLMAKPMVVTLPFVMLLLDFWPLQRVTGDKWPVTSFLRLVAEKIPFFLLVAASCVITCLAQRVAVASLQNVPLHYRLENMPVAYANYLIKMAWPAQLAVFYPLNPLPRLEVAEAVAALAAISWLVWRVRRASPYWLTGWLWFLGTLVPVIGLVQVGGAAMADRYAYFPSIGVFLAVALGARDAANRLPVSNYFVAAIGGLVLAACLALTHIQLSYWQNDIALFSHACDITQNNDAAHLNLGIAYEKAGRKAEALAEYRIALKLAPDRADAHNNVANLLDDMGHPAAAAAEYQEALRINPKHIAAHNNYGTLLVEQGRFDEAMKQYTAAARLDSNDWHAPYLIGKLLLKEGRDPEAIPHFRQAVQLDPNNPRVLTYLAQVLASDENPQVRDGNAALAMAAKANDLTGDVQPAMIDAMAMAYAEIGQFTNAQQSAANALKLATAYGITNDVILIQQRLQLYQNNQPFRQSFLLTNAPAHQPPEN